MATIPVLTIIDCASVLANFTGGSSSSNATYLGAWGTANPYVYMLAQDSYVVSDQAQSELTIKANVGDQVQWSISCIGQGTQYNTILSKVSPGTNGGGISTPECLPLTVNLYVGCGSANSTPVTFTSYCIGATVLNVNSGQVQYTVTFQIVDQTGKSWGYFYWDPFINVNN